MSPSMPLLPLLKKRAATLRQQLFYDAVLWELEGLLIKQRGTLQDKAQQSFIHDHKVISYDQEQRVHLEEALQLDHFMLLKDAFTSQKTSDAEPGSRSQGTGVGCAQRLSGRTRRREGTMTLEEFQDVLKALLGSEQWASQTAVLFKKVDASCDGLVDWDKFCSYILMQYSEKEYISQPKGPFVDPQPVIRHCKYNKQETTNCILAVSHPPPLRFISVSREGTLTIWDSNLEVLKAQELSRDCSEGDGNKRKFRKWTTDAVYMPNVHKIAVATTSRDIYFWDVSTSNCFEEFHLFGIKNVPTSLYYWYDSQTHEQRSLLLWGDDSGSVNLLWFLKPQTGMFENTFSKGRGLQKVFMQDIQDHSTLVTYQLIPGIHQETINKIVYEPHGERIITSSGSATSSVIIMDVSLKNKSYTWDINKGVTCFDFSKSLGLLVTAGMDPSVRLWNQYVTSRPVATLQGHCTTVLDVAIYEPLGQIFSYSKDAVLKVWDILSQHCVKTLLLKFPCVRMLGAFEHGNRPMLLLSSTPHVLLVSCRDYLGLLRLQRSAAEGVQLVTHAVPISCALYNPYFKQLAIGCRDSTVSMWNIETGAKCLQLTNAHGQEEITCMTFDPSQRRLITGARNGTIKVWNILNGHNVHKLEAVADAVVTGVVCLQDNRLLAVGRSHKITQYNITNAKNLYVEADMSWKLGQLHREDILAVDYCPAQGLLATASSDGEIIIWTMDSQKPLLHINCPKGSRAHSDPAEGSRAQERTKFRKQSTYSWERELPTSVEELLFLQWRASGSQWMSHAILVSAEAGRLCWWSVAGPGHKHGCFYAPETAHESVLGLSSDRLNRFLVSGDTAGSIQVWDISQFPLGLAYQTTADTPPLLHRWRAHNRALVSVELLAFEDQMLLTSASIDQTARLWTVDGRYVGTFGQGQKWNLQDPASNQHPRDPWSSLKNRMGEEDTGCDQSLGGAGVPEQADLREPASEASQAGQSSDYERSAQLPLDYGELRPVSPSDSPPQAENTKVLLGRQVAEGLQRRLAARQERRVTFGDINISKLFNADGVFTPFQTLAIPECQEMWLPSDLPMSTWMLRQRLMRERDTDLVSLSPSGAGEGHELNP